eukprot:5538793-Prymnesium_polylepis.1
MLVSRPGAAARQADAAAARRAVGHAASEQRGLPRRKNKSQEQMWCCRDVRTAVSCAVAASISAYGVHQ